jgi:hypothetical protein
MHSTCEFCCANVCARREKKHTKSGGGPERFRRSDSPFAICHRLPPSPHAYVRGPLTTAVSSRIICSCFCFARLGHGPRHFHRSSISSIFSIWFGIYSLHTCCLSFLLFHCRVWCWLDVNDVIAFALHIIGFHPVVLCELCGRHRLLHHALTGSHAMPDEETAGEGRGRVR